MKPVHRVRVATARSNIVVALALIASAASAILVVALTLPWWLRASIVGGCALQCALALHGLASRPHVLALSADRRVLATGMDGVERGGVVTDGTYVSAWLTCLAWRADGQCFENVCLIAPDTLSVEERRQLRVVLRWGRVPQPEAEGEALV